MADFPPESPSGPLFSYDFKISGKLSGVGFVKHTVRQAKELHLRGWVRPARKGIVRGHIEGQYHDLNDMKNWLTYRGSPHCQIRKAIFTDLTAIPAFGYLSFAKK